MGGAGHVGPIDLNDLITRLEAAVTGHQALREHLLNLVICCARRLVQERPSMAVTGHQIILKCLHIYFFNIKLWLLVG